MIYTPKRLCSVIFWLSFFMLLPDFSYAEKKIVTIENQKFKYEISTQGKNLHFIEKSSGIDYLAHDADSWCAGVMKDGRNHPVTSVTANENHLFFIFASADVTADVLLTRRDDRITFTVRKVHGDPESLTFLNIPLSLQGMPFEPFSTCALSLNLHTHVRQIPALQTHLWACCYSRIRLEDAAVTLVAVPPQEMLALIRDVIAKAPDIPFSDKGGAWALSAKEGYGSYLMNFGTLTEETVDEWIAMCQSLGFNQIDNHGGGEFFRFGDFQLNPKKWPDGWASFTRINHRLHQAGLSSIFHTYAFFIDKNSKYVTPVPDEHLGDFRTFHLAAPLQVDDTEMVVQESTAGISTTTGFFVRNSLSLRINAEIIEFTGVTTQPPYKFNGLKRGACGTKASSFPTGASVHHLREMFGRFVPNPESPLFDTIAAETAEIVNNCGFDGIYFDAIDGSDILGGEENFWYYGTKFIFAVAKRLVRPVGMEMSSMSHHWWHYRSRWQAWDRPVRGYKRFIDIHAAAIKSTRLFLPAEIKSNENEHGLWRGHAPLIDKYAGMENGGLLLPLHLGWWGNQTWNPPQVEPTFTDDIEYLCCKMLGNNAGVSMLGGVEKENLDRHPLFKRLIAIIKQYEELRQRGYFSAAVRNLLRQPGKEFTLVNTADGEWKFKPVSYQKHKVAGLNHPSARWRVHHPFQDQPLKLRIEPLLSIKPFHDSAAVDLADFSASDQFQLAGSAKGVSGGITMADEKAPSAGKSVEFHAGTTERLAKEGLWLKMEREFDPWLNLAANQALGVWVKGDSSNQLLNLRVESPSHLSHGARGDHFIKIDFIGWRYFELVEIESTEFSNYIWPDSGFYVYDSFRHTVRFDAVNRLQLWYNNLPPGKEVCCSLSAIKALPVVAQTISHPAITVGDKTILFPIKMESGMYLEFLSGDDCKLYGSKGELLQEVRYVGDIPVLHKGDNEISFSCESSGIVSERVQVTVISEGELMAQ